MCLFMGDKHWFVCVGQDPGGLWTYILFKLTSEQIRIEEEWHELFRRHVGHHTDYQEKGRMVGGVRPQGDWELYYSRAKDKPPLGLEAGQAVAFYRW
jgi:hypothetical protein